MSQLVSTGPTVATKGVVRRSDRGLVSAEWAMVIIAAVAIVGVLVSILTSGPIQEVLMELIKKIIGGALTGI